MNNKKYFKAANEILKAGYDGCFELVEVFSNSGMPAKSVEVYNKNIDYFAFLKKIKRDLVRYKSLEGSVYDPALHTLSKVLKEYKINLKEDPQ